MVVARLDPIRMNLNKWEMHKALQYLKIPYVHLPETIIATPQNLTRFLEHQHQVYIKPVGTWGGHKIARITQRPAPLKHQVSTWQPQNSMYVWQQQGNHPISFATPMELQAHYLFAYSNTFCIAQTAAPIQKFQERPFDVRLLMQRELNNAWTTAGSVVRIGGQGAIVSNIGISQGEVMSFDTLCQKLKLNRTTQRRVERRLKQAGLAICSALAPYRHFNEIGIDFGLGQDHELWVIEVNTDDALGGPSHELFANLPDKRIYHEIEARKVKILTEVART